MTVPRLWIPGPTHVRPEILAECARPMIGHRAPEMAELIERSDPHLPYLFGFDPGRGARAAIASCSASGLMEAALRGVDGGKVLCVVGGAFAKRFGQMCAGLGLEHDVLDVTWGEAVEPAALAEQLARGGPYAAVTVVANETSTGVVADLPGIAKAVHEAAPETLLVVDAVTLAAGQPVGFDEHGLDFAITGSQKALALPPGLALCAASARYQSQAANAPRRGWYLDPLRQLDGQTKRKTPSTPAIPLYAALARQLEEISAGVVEGGGFADPCAAWQARFDRHARLRRRTLAWAADRGLEAFPPDPDRQSRTVSCVKAGDLDIGSLKKRLEVEHGLSISNGYGDLKGKTFRIGHMGDHTDADLERLLSAMDAVLA